ncbi:MAG: penicillin-binding protein [Myxococcota bacterium]
MTKREKKEEVKKGRGYTRRLIVTLFIFAAFVGWIARSAYSIMIIENQRYSKLASYQQEKEVVIPPKRGKIETSDGKETAVSLDVFSLYAHPHKVVDSQGAARLLAPLLEQPVSSIIKKLSSKKRFVWLKRRLEPGVGERFIKLKEMEAKSKSATLTGIESLVESKRFYPNGDFMAHILGGMGIDNPLGGVEFSMNKYLKGNEITLVKYRDARGRSLFSEGYVPQTELEGFSVKLTIESALQYVLETELAKTVQEFEARRGTAILQEPSTGRILAIASYPAYDPNKFVNAEPEALVNMSINFVYEPGSTFKIFIVAAALEEGVVSPDDKIFAENGRFQVANRVIKDVHPEGMLTLTEVIKKSSNIASAKVGQKLGREKFYSYIEGFGFGMRTGIELPGEERGLVQPLNRIGEVELATISFGQGISVTPLQLITAASAIANKGIVMKPRLIKEVLDAEGNVVKSGDPEIVRRVLSEKSANIVAGMMSTVTESGGTAAKARIPGIKFAGKTGTAQKVDPKSRVYAKDKFVSSFVGFAPADDPRFSVLVVIDEAKKATYGGIVAAPTAKRIIVEALKHYGLYTAEEAANEPSASATALNFPVYEQRSGGVEIVNDEVWGRDEEGEGELSVGTPDFIGMSLYSAIKAAAKAGLTVSAKGSGRVKAQSPKAGEPLPPEGELRLFLKEE